MTIGYYSFCLITAMILLAGGAQNHEVPQLKSQLVTLKRTQANRATALERQNRLKHNSINDTYLLLAANSATKPCSLFTHYPANICQLLLLRWNEASWILQWVDH